MRLAVLTSMLLGVLISGPATACGVETDCEIGKRVYRIAMPESGAAKGALVYMHGYRGSQKGAMKNKGLRSLAHDRGLALVSTKSSEEDWMIPGVPADPSASGEVELAYFDALIDTLEARHGIPRENLIASGFSAGGMMIWNLACHRGDSFRAFIPIAGTFWEPVPDANACETYPVDMVHIHGTSDKIVPLGGRPIRTTHQGDVPTALERLRAAGGYSGARRSTEADLTCETSRTPAGDVLAFCTHSGGHSFKTDYLRTAFKILDNPPSN